MNKYFLKSQKERVLRFLEQLDYEHPTCNNKETLCYLNSIVEAVKAFNSKKENNYLYLGSCLPADQDNNQTFTHCWNKIDGIRNDFNISNVGIQATREIKELRVCSTWTKEELKKELIKFFIAE